MKRLQPALLTCLELALGAVALAALAGCRGDTPANATTTNDSSGGSKMAAKLIPRDVLFGNPQRAQGPAQPRRQVPQLPGPGRRRAERLGWPGRRHDASQAGHRGKGPRRSAATTGPTTRSTSSTRKTRTATRISISLPPNVDTGETKDLTPIDGVRAELQEVSPKFPNEILVGLNDRDKQLHDVWRVNIDTGEKKLVQENPGVAGYITDDDFNVRLALNYTPTGGQVWLLPEGERRRRSTWKEFQEFGPEDAMTSGPAGFDKTARHALLRGQPRPRHGRPVRHESRRPARSS